MIGGDLSNEVTPRLLVVYDGVLAEQHRQPAIPRWRRSNWPLVVSTYDVNQQLVAQLWQVVMRLSVRFDVATFLPAAAVPHVREQLEMENIPVSNVRSYASPQDLATALADMPDVIGVYDLADRAAAYGGKGQDVALLGRLLR